MLENEKNKKQLSNYSAQYCPPFLSLTIIAFCTALARGDFKTILCDVQLKKVVYNFTGFEVCMHQHTTTLT